jgi:putative endonuclease
MFFVYVIRSEVNGHFYVGLTSNVFNRVNEHNKGMTKSTKPFRPWKLFFFAEFSTRLDARMREKY